MDVVQTRTIWDGDSEVVLLPEGMGFGIGTEVHVVRNGDTITIRPVSEGEPQPAPSHPQ